MSSATKFTSGPWQVEEGHVQRDSGGIRYWQVSDGQDAIACNQFCYAGYDPEQNLANAALIAAAPELYAACAALIAAHDANDVPAGEIAVAEMRAALAKSGAVA